MIWKTLYIAYVAMKMMIIVLSVVLMLKMKKGVQHNACY
mgnify:CR=1 FL=1